MSYTPSPDRYDNPSFYRRCGRWGLKLPAISLGCWHNFGGDADHEHCKRMLFDAFDLGITHFDLANNYGPPPGGAEQRVGKIIKDMPRDELIIASKAGWPMWPGPYGDLGTRKYLLGSLDQSLKRLDLEYLDIFYHHRPDPDTPMDESLGALDQAVRSGKALYAGISNYNGEETDEAVRICKDNGFAPLLIHQPKYSMFNRMIEDDLLEQTQRHGLGVIPFSPLAQGLLSDKYLDGIPDGSRAASTSPFLQPGQITDPLINKLRKLNDIAKQRSQSLAQMALAWVLRDPQITSALIGASSSKQIRDNVAAADNVDFSDEELRAIDQVLA